MKTDHRINYFLGEYIHMLESGPGKRDFLRDIALGLTEIIVKNSKTINQPTLYELFDVLNQIALYLVEIQEPITTHELSV